MSAPYEVFAQRQLNEMADKIGRLQKINGELLSALKAMVNRWEPAPDGHADRRMWEDACDAIAKAEDRT